MAVSPVSPRMRRMQWVAIALITFAIALNYIDRSTLAVGNIKIRQEFGITATAIGALQAAWSVTYAFAQIPVGFLLDRFGPRYLVGFALILWSLAQGAGGFALSYAQLLLSRIALGVTESPAFPAAVRVTSDWFHVRDRGGPTGVYNSGGSIGPAIAPPVLTAIMLLFDWRVMFIAMGVLGVMSALVWFRLYRDPHTTPLEPQDEAYLAHNRAGASRVEAQQWGRLFRFRSMWGLTLGAFCAGYAVWLYQTWLPAYLEMQQHISIARTGLLASIPLVCSILGAISGGWVSDRLARRGADLVGSRRLPCILGLLASGAFTMIAATAGNATEAVISISCAMYFLSFGVAGKWVMITAVAPQSYCTSVASIQNFGGYLGGTASPLVTGFVVDRTGSFVIALAIGAGMTLLAAAALQLLVRDPIGAAELGGVPVAAT
ncbi:MAG: MFS transporter [Acetobacteraceae bacterium]|nr:MFS transporter [Acetobacteraceae bacterium]